jgi:hypothetical protein
LLGIPASLWCVEGVMEKGVFENTKIKNNL